MPCCASINIWPSKFWWDPKIPCPRENFSTMDLEFQDFFPSNFLETASRSPFGNHGTYDLNLTRFQLSVPHPTYRLLTSARCSWSPCSEGGCDAFGVLGVQIGYEMGTWAASELGTSLEGDICYGSKPFWWRLAKSTSRSNSSWRTWCR